MAASARLVDAGFCYPHYADWHRAQFGRKNTLFRRDCGWCGKPFESTSHRTRSCCHQHGLALGGRIRLICEVPDSHPSRSTAVPQTHPSRIPLAPVPRLFDKKCEWCGGGFQHSQPHAAFCSRRCRKAKDRARSGSRFRISPIRRQAIYSRDNWTCQLCMGPVDSTLPVTDPWAATLDHIECQSHALIADHSDSNLRLAHRWCNCVRGDERYYTAADLAA